jgi:ubiquitin C-terminal hydrolase
MNAILQVLFHLPDFISDLQTCCADIDPTILSIARELVRLNSLSPAGTTDPTSFLSAWSACVPVLPLGVQHDAPEFVQILAEQVERELSPFLESGHHRLSRSLMLCRDPFTRNFAFSMMIRIECQCREPHLQRQSGFVLAVPVSHSLDESLRRVFEPPPLEFRCGKCRATRANVRVSLTRLPRVFFFQIQRFGAGGSTKSLAVVKLPDVLDLGPFVDRDFCAGPLPPKARTGSAAVESGNGIVDFFEFAVVEDDELVRRTPSLRAEYRLIALVLHDGATVAAGHFRAAVREGRDWRIFDDGRTAIGAVEPAAIYCAVYAWGRSCVG